MRINIEFLIVAYIISQFVDWVFQWQWQASNKSKWGAADNKIKSLKALVSHSLIYAVLTSGALLLLQTINGGQFWLVLSFLFVTHGVVDTRLPVKWIMRFKGVTSEQMKDLTNYGFMHIGIDHRLHEISLLILAMLV